MAGAARAPRIPDGQHVALLQFQRDQLQQGVLAADYYFGGRVHLQPLELRPAYVSRHVLYLRRERNRDSPGRPGTPPVEARTADSGDQDCLTIRRLPLWAAKPCSPVRCAILSPP